MVARELPFHCTVEDEMKFPPVNVNVNATPPAVAEAGLKDTMLGVGFDGGGGGFDPPLPGTELPPPHEASNVSGTIQAKVNNRFRRFLKASPMGDIILAQIQGR